MDISGLLTKLLTAEPAVIAFLQIVVPALAALLKALGIQLPAAQAHSAEVEGLIARNVEAHKLGDGTLLKTFIGLLGTPAGASLLQLILGLIGTKPAA